VLLAQPELTGQLVPWQLVLRQPSELAAYLALGHRNVVLALRLPALQPVPNLGRLRAVCALPEARRLRMPNERIRPYPAI